MPEYRRNYQKGGTYFFTVVTYRRLAVFDNDDAVTILRESFKACMHNKPFKIDAIAVLPDHLHCIWTLPSDDENYSVRWKEIKADFTKQCIQSRKINTPTPTASMVKKGEKGIWQRRFWEHTITDDRDYAIHCDYLHYNPVKHGLAAKPYDWPYSSFRRFVDKGVYPRNWGEVEFQFPKGLGGE
ncbi:MAG: transposase [Deltaproteobacteria bacterium]|nr:transposase [Deltaproteobacteria bacterium]